MPKSAQPRRHRYLLFLSILIFLFSLLSLLNIMPTTPMKAAENGVTAGKRFYRLPSARPNVIDIQNLLRPIDPTGAQILTPIYQGVEDEEAEAGSGGKPKAKRRWLLQPSIFGRLSQAAQNYLLYQHMPQLRQRQRLTKDSPDFTRQLAQTSLDANENRLVNNPVLDRDDRTQSETSATSFGDTIVVSFNDSAGIELRNFSGVSVSQDGGKSWQQSRIPNFDSFNLGDGVVAADTRGNFYYAMIAIDGNETSMVTVSRSTDGGNRWSRPVDASTTANRNNNFHDKEWLTVDRSPSSRYRDKVYVSWTNFQSNGRPQIMFSSSKRRGRSFTPAQAIAMSAKSNGFVQGSMVTTGPNGEIYITWIDTTAGNLFNTTDIMLSRSTNGGKSFSAPIKVASFTNAAFPANGIFSGNEFPSIAVDISETAARGNIYITYSARPAKAPDRADILMVRSTDNGLSWSQPVKLNDDNSTAEQLLPSIAVAADGAVAATWYDRRNDAANLSLLDVYATVSTDGGNSFSRNRRITNANWPLVPTPFNLRAGYHGDYHQLAVRGNQFLFNWADDRSGRDSDIYLALKTAAELTTPTPDFILSARTSFQAIKPGATTTFLIDSVSIDGVGEGEISFEASPMIPGLSYQFNTSSAMPRAGVLLQVTADASVPPGPYLVTITGRRGTQARSTATRLTILDIDTLVKNPQNITTNATGSIFPVSSIDAAGNINIAWLDDSPGLSSIFFIRSTDGGKSFSQPLMLPRNQSFIGVPLLVSNEREIYIAHLELFETPRLTFRTMLTRSTDGGKTFSPTQAVSTDDDIFVIPESIQMDIDGTLHFGVTTFTPPDPSKPIFTDFDARSTDGGRTFTLNKIAQSSSPLSSPIIALEGDGKTERVIFIDFSRQNGGLLQTRSTDGGVTFAPPIPIITKTDSLLFAGAFFSDNNRTDIVYGEGDFTEDIFKLFYTRTGNDGRFLPPVQINGDAVTILTAGFGVDENNNVVVAFEGSFNKFSDEDYLSRIFYCNSTDGGVTFSKPDSFTPARGGDLFPSVILDRKGDFSIIWDGFNQDTLDIFYSQSPDKGRSFPQKVNLTSNAGLSSYADFSFDRNGRVQMLWQDNSPGSYDIFRTTLGRD